MSTETTAPVIVVTGTGPDVGKTVATAALAVGFRDQGLRVAVVKPCQTGVGPGEDGDLAQVRQLAGDVQTHELVRLPDPLAPDAAARRAGVSIPPVPVLASQAAQVARREDVDLVLVEGTGGLLVRLDLAGGTLADLALSVQELGLRVGVVVVAAAGLGTLNHSALTAEALQLRGLDCLGFVIGSWPEDPDLAMTFNLEDLPEVTGAPLLGRIPEGAGSWDPQTFQDRAGAWLPIF
ncbi:dethiobiotin synthase [Arsenicicoccus cauae]|uniref:ATP-dependent dethiobiotin synthetase BioD n=1 Tax=Arsenicicoccus cauae TaxID=2663847 RepID=A0A6I3IVV4_9MICO|nr:dethiobiotin synthase [Arsenicicoccus cauae]MTB72451.1 ATP-dependent dethiobiotin synthetase BioD [Arsenicicoccus cauae]